MFIWPFVPFNPDIEVSNTINILCIRIRKWKRADEKRSGILGWILDLKAEDNIQPTKMALTKREYSFAFLFYLIICILEIWQEKIKSVEFRMNRISNYSKHQSKHRVFETSVIETNAHYTFMCLFAIEVASTENEDRLGQKLFYFIVMIEWGIWIA